MLKQLTANNVYKFFVLISFLWSILIVNSVPAKAQVKDREFTTHESVSVTKLPDKSKRWALIIGVDQYQDGQIGSLKGADHDAESLADALTRYAGFPQDQVVLLSTSQPQERQPTRVNILRRLSNLASVIPADGLLLISFSGHGIERNKQAYLLPSDAQISEDVSFLEDTAIGLPRLEARIRETNVDQVLILLDACRNDPTGRADAPNRMTEAYIHGFDFNAQNQEIRAFATLYATDVGDRAYEYTEKQQGYFTWALIEGLKGGAANEKHEITLATLIKYIQEVVPKRVGIDLGAGKKQKPYAKIEGFKAEDLVIAVVDKNAPSVADKTQATVVQRSLQASPEPALINKMNNSLTSSAIDSFPIFAFTEASTGAVIQIVIDPINDELRNGILYSLAASKLSGTESQPTKVLEIKNVTVDRIAGDDPSDCNIKETVNLNYEVNIREASGNQLQSSQVSRGSVCLENYADSNIAIQMAIRNAVKELKLQLASLPR